MNDNQKKQLGNILAASIHVLANGFNVNTAEENAVQVLGIISTARALLSEEEKPNET